MVSGSCTVPYPRPLCFCTCWLHRVMTSCQFEEIPHFSQQSLWEMINSECFCVMCIQPCMILAAGKLVCATLRGRVLSDCLPGCVLCSALKLNPTSPQTFSGMIHSNLFGNLSSHQSSAFWGFFFEQDIGKHFLTTPYKHLKRIKVHGSCSDITSKSCFSDIK